MTLATTVVHNNTLKYENLETETIRYELRVPRWYSVGYGCGQECGGGGGYSFYPIPSSSVSLRLMAAKPLGTGQDDQILVQMKDKFVADRDGPGTSVPVTETENCK